MSIILHSLSLDGQEVLFSSKDVLCAWNLSTETTKLVTLGTHDPRKIIGIAANHQLIAFSENGKLILFNRSSQQDICIAGEEAILPKERTAQGFSFTIPNIFKFARFDESNQHIVFSAGFGHDRDGVGGWEVLLSGTLNKRKFSPLTIDFGEPGYHQSASLSLDGSTLAFKFPGRGFRLPHHGAVQPDGLYLINMHRSFFSKRTIKVPLPRSAKPILKCGNHGLSRSGDMLVFSAMHEGMQSQVYFYQRKGGLIRQMSLDGAGRPLNGWNENVMISADGQTIAYGTTAVEITGGKDAVRDLARIIVQDVSTGVLQVIGEHLEGYYPYIDNDHLSLLSADGNVLIFHALAKMGRQLPADEDYACGDGVFALIRPEQRYLRINPQPTVR